MTLTFQDGELRQLLREHSQRIQPALLADRHDQTLTYPDWLGTGHKRDIELPSGIYLTLHQYRLNEPLVNVCEPGSNDCFEFVFSLTAHSVYNDHHRLGERQACLCGPQWQGGRWHEFSEQAYLSVDVHLDPPLLTALTESDAAALPRAIAQMLSGKRVQPYPEPIAITPAMQTALWQILQCPYQGLTQKLYLEAKSLELIALFLESAANRAPTHPTLNREDVERIHHARHILLNTLQTPPSLVELARQVGLNDRKLKEGFRQVFNTTVFGYLTQQRLEKACQLLAQQYSIAAVAAAVGYTSPTAFSGAFRRKFGVTPKGYQMGQRFGA